MVKRIVTSKTTTRRVEYGVVGSDDAAARTVHVKESQRKVEELIQQFTGRQVTLSPPVEALPH